MSFKFTDTEPNIQDLRTAKLQSALRKFAVVVAGRNLDFNIVTSQSLRPYGSPPAWSDASTINVWHDPEKSIMDVDSLVRIKGLTIHELGHVLFTEFFSTDDGHEYLLPLLHGRKYVPQKIRDLSASVYHQPHNVADIQRIIDKYIVLNMARKDDIATALELVREFHSLIDSDKDLSQHSKTDVCAPAKNGGDDMAGVREQDDALRRALKQQANQVSNNDNSGPPSGTQSDKQSLEEQIAKAQEQVVDSIYEDIKSMVQGMRSGSGTSGSSSGDKRVTPAKGTFLKPVSSESQIASRDFSRVLTELKALHDPSWVSHESSGRLNAREFLMGAGFDQSFDLWDDDKADVTDIECVILLDISGSMYNVMDKAYDSMWSIKRALDSVQASTTVVTFGDYSRILYSADSLAHIHRKHSWDGAGSTNPLHGVKYARDVLMNSPRAIKLFIVITDGYWYDKAQCDAAITELRVAGVLTGQVFIVDTWYQNRMQEGETMSIDAHGCEVVQVVTDPTDITDFARKLVHRQQYQLLNS